MTTYIANQRTLDSADVLVKFSVCEFLCCSRLFLLLCTKRYFMTRYTKGGVGVRNKFHCGVGTPERLLLCRTKDEGIDLLIGD